MKQLNELFNILDISQAEQRGFSPKRKYEQDEPKKINRPKRARFKMMVYFKDGNRRMFYSLDGVTSPKTQSKHIDEYEGLTWLMNCIRKYVEKDVLDNAQIYASVNPEPYTKEKAYNILLFQVTQRYKIYSANIEFKLNGINTVAKVTPLIKKVIKRRLDA